MPWFLRGLLLAAAGFLVQLALLPQSRASLIVIPFALVFYLLVTPNRIRAFIALALALGATALAAPTILDVYTVATDGGNVGEALSSAADAMLIACAGLLVAGTLIGLLDGRLELSRSTERTAGRVGIALSAVAVVAGIVIGLAAVGNPGDWLNDRWQDFKGDYDKGGFQTSRLTGDLGSGRYDFWSVGLNDEFTSAPGRRRGGRQLRRRLPRAPRHRRGAVLPAQPPGPAPRRDRDRRHRPLPGLPRGRRRRRLPDQAPLSGPPGTGGRGGRTRHRRLLPPPQQRRLALDVRRDNDAGDRLARHRRRRDAGPRAGPPDAAAAAGAGPIGMIAAAALVAIAAAVSLAVPWISARLTDSAASGWPDDPQEAYSRLDTARDLNPLSARPDLVAGTIAIRDDDPTRAAAAFARAAEREPTNWYARIEASARWLSPTASGPGGSPSSSARES